MNRAIEYCKKLRELLIWFKGGVCQFCRGKCGETEKDKKLEFAHRHGHETKVKGRGRGSKERVYDVAYHPDDYLLLCHFCHKIYDNPIINPESSEAYEAS